MNIRIAIKGAILFLLSYACAETALERSYEIRGMAPISDNGKQVQLYVFQDGVFSLIDSTTVRDGAFWFRGRTDREKIGMISVRQSEEMPLLFVLENNRLEARIDTFSSISGTLLNDRFQHYIDEISPIELRLNKLSSSLMSRFEQRSFDRYLYDSIHHILSREEDLLRRYTTDFIDENDNNVAGAYIFAQNSFLYSDDIQSRIIANAGRNFRDEYPVNWIARLLDSGRKTDRRASYLDLPFLLPDGQETTLTAYLQQNEYLLLIFRTFYADRDRPNDLSLWREDGSEVPVLPVSVWLGPIDALTPFPESGKGIGLKPANENVADLLLQYVIKSDPYVVLLDSDGVFVADAVSVSNMNHIIETVFK